MTAAYAQNTGHDVAATPPIDATPGATGTAVEQPQPEHKAFPPFDSTTFSAQLFWLAITFVALYLILAKVAIPRIGGILAQRKGRIDGDLAAAEAAKKQSEAAEAAYDKALADARANAFAIAEKARETAKAAADAERGTIEAGLAKKLAEAESRIAEIKTRALGEVGGIAGEATGAIVKALIGADASADEVSGAVAKSMAK